MQSKGVINAYPDLYARGSNAHPEAACYSRPQIIDVLGGWIRCVAGMNHVTEIDVWMTENLGSRTGCQCTDFGCAYGNRDLLELQAILDGWQRARQQFPELRLRVLTSEETAGSNEEILAMLPPGVGFEYYHSLLTYNSQETGIIPGYVQQAAQNGRHVGVCPNLSPAMIGGIVEPFSGAHFVRYRIREFLDKGLAGLMGYPKPRVFYYAFNVRPRPNGRGTSMAAPRATLPSHGRCDRASRRPSCLPNGPRHSARWPGTSTAPIGRSMKNERAWTA
jgi:hypothetical protein